MDLQDASVHAAGSVVFSRPAKTRSIPFTWLDVSGIAIAVALIFAVPIVNGHGRIFWEDETLGWVLLRDPSWRHMLHAWLLGADGGGIFFYVLGRAWFRAFGDGVLAFRLFSAATFGLATGVFWTALRRFYPAGIVAFAVTNTFFFSPPLTMHFMEGRFYGLLMLGTALVFLCTLVLDDQANPPGRWYCFLFLAHLLLTGSHVLGVLYSASGLAALLILDHRRGRRRPWLYAAACLPWLLLVLERTALRATARVGKPHFWTKAPVLGQVIGSTVAFSPEVLCVVLFLMLAGIARLPKDRRSLYAVLCAGFAERRAPLIAAGCLLCVPAFLLMEGLTGTWLFADRYLQPVALATACLTAELCTLAFRSSSPDHSRFRWLRNLGACACVPAYAAFVIFWVFRHEAAYTPSVPDFTAELARHIPRGAPVVVEDAFTFTELMSRPAGAERPFTYLLDWPYALSPQAPRMEVTQYHLMQNWRQAGYFSGHIEDRARFLEIQTCFYVVSNTILGGRPEERPEHGNPVAMQLARMVDYDVRPVYVLDRLHGDEQRDTVWFVRRLGSAGPMCSVPRAPNSEQEARNRGWMEETDP